MGKSDVLDRVAADLARGHTQPAIQRLSSLVAAHPTDLDLRLRLAAAHRLVGDAVEAGRWSYLDADADPAETRAFERAYPSAGQRLRRLRWPDREGHPATDFARARLTGLIAAGRAGSGDRRRLAPALLAPVRLPAVGTPALWLVGVPLVALAIIGAVTLLRWLAG
ncbi:MAG: hypothetical protein J2P15_07940 [Micromonosporaceae bacterium]|nr:hypothetical protein [Micromonosporaceae bacterium]